ncbi:MAG: ABC transporter permease subunit [Dehalococcoidia bacterium]|nr:ABC transporter permease subunit [Dehalococcoidia bacterium]
MSTIAIPGRAPGFWHRRRTRRLAIQAAFGVLVALILLYLLERALGLQLGFEFLRSRAGFAISHQWATDFSANNSRLDAYLTGVWNTVRLVVVGLLLATFLGVLAGVSRLSSNWLVAKIALVYVEVFRNTPLLIQIIFWYTAVFLRLPPTREGIQLFDLVFLSNRALVIPWAFPQDGIGVWLIVLAGAAVAAWAVRRWRIADEERTGQPGRGNTMAVTLFVLLAAVSYALTDQPLDLEVPTVNPPVNGSFRGMGGGLQVSPEFAGLLVGLVMYTGAFIAEIVRGSIQALPRGQGEASQALGLGAYDRMTLIILPQALRIMIPPLTNQYLNLTKNSSLAVAIAYPELFFVGGTIQNNAGHAVPMFLLIMATYLVLSGVTATAMNVLNRRVQVVGNN